MNETEEATGSEPAPGEPPVDDALSTHRVSFDVLADRAIGTTSRPVEFNWRRSQVQLALNGSHLFELNNFNSLRGGGLIRLPTGGMIAELGVNYVRTWDSPSSRMLALTPFRQAGHPDHLEFDFTVGIPLAEGVVTTLPRILPAVQMVFNGYASVRYLLYPKGFRGLNAKEVGQAIFAPALSEDEIDNLDDARLASMSVDPGRYGILLGFGNDLYLKQGVFLSPRFMLAVPLMAPATQTDLLFWSDFSLAIGVAL